MSWVTTIRGAAADPTTGQTVGASNDRGSSAIELVLITPVLIALVFGLIQTAIVWNARHTVSAAAQHGARTARTSTALTPAVTAASTNDPAADEQVRTSTLAYLRQTGGQGLQEPTVAIRHDGTFVVVSVSGTALGLLPGTTVRVSSSSRTPVEGFRP
jgi:Flp pilus assembly protein TadG